MPREQVWDEILEDFVFIVLDGDFLVVAAVCCAEKFDGLPVLEGEGSVVCSEAFWAVQSVVCGVPAGVVLRYLLVAGATFFKIWEETQVVG